MWCTWPVCHLSSYIQCPINWNTPSILQLDAQHKHHPKELSIGRAILGTFVHVQTWNLSRNSSWWFQPLWKNLSQIGSFPPSRDKNKKYLKRPPRIALRKRHVVQHMPTFQPGYQHETLNQHLSGSWFPFGHLSHKYRVKIKSRTLADDSGGEDFL